MKNPGREFVITFKLYKKLIVKIFRALATLITTGLTGVCFLLLRVETFGQ